MLVRIKETFKEVRDFRLWDKPLPKIGDEWADKGYEDAYIYYIRCVNDQIAETTAGYPVYEYDFYYIYIDMEDDQYIERICIKKEE